ncbi:MAG: hypothetical protein JSS99_07250 [Actinobacteria bacterium]|nr:hypothetical protein [Actinomycetota bacterium]
MPGTPQLKIEDLGKIDMLDIEARAGRQNVRRTETAVADGSYGEPILFALTLLTAAALRAYVAHTVANVEMAPTRELTQKVTVLRDGEVVEVREITFKERRGEPLADTVVRELSAIPGLDTALGELAT